MRIFDKKIKMKKANILAEQRYLESKGLLKEESLKDKLSNLEGKRISLIKTNHTVKYNPEKGENDKVTKAEDFDGIIGQIGEFEGYKTPGFWVMNNDGKKKGFVMYDNKTGNFIEGNSTFSYTFKGKTPEDEGILQLIKNTVSNNESEDKTITEETFSDLFDFFNTDPKNMSQGSVYYVGDMNSSMNKNIIDDNGNKVPNPLYGKLFKHTRFMFKWEDTFSKAMDRIDPDYVMGQRSGNFEKIDGYKVLEKGPNGLYFPIIPTGSEYKLFVDNNGNMEEIEKEKVQKFLRPASPSASKITSGDKATFRLLMLDKIVKITGGGNVWINPNFKGEYKGLGTVTEEPATPKDQYDFIKSSIESASGDEVGEKEVDENGRAVYPSLNHRHVYYFTGDEFNGDIIKNDTETGERYPIGNINHYGESNPKDGINNTMY